MSSDLAIGIAGSGGDGVILLGELLSKAAANVGMNTMLTKSFGPQIRGGESSSRIRVSDKPLSWAGDRIDALMVFHWSDFKRFRSELMFKQDCEIVVDIADKTPDEDIPIPERYKERIKKIPFEQIAMDSVKTKQAKNMVMAGVICELFNWPYEGVEAYINQRFAKYGDKMIATNIKAVDAGREYVRNHFKGDVSLKIKYKKAEPLMFISGNDAFAYGALCAGCRFMAGYPITPATEILEWMSRELPRFDGVCVQSEDEISAMCMIIGASFGGLKSLTATSGPGLALKQEAIGLAVIAEIPVVICNVMRGGPSTGLPTRTEQSDLNIAIYGGHGDCPRVVLAATNITECYELAHIAFEIAEKYQTPVIVLLDQYLGHSQSTTPMINIRSKQPKQEHAWFIANYTPDKWDERFGKLEDYLGSNGELPWRRYPTPDELKAGYQRFAFNESGVSPMSVPGIKGGEYMAVGIEHEVSGNPSSSHHEHQAQNEKRYRKINGINQEYQLFNRAGSKNPKLGILTWGSTFGVCEEISELLCKAGLETQVLAPQILYPLPAKQIQSWLDSVDQLVTVETNYSDQFYHYIKAYLDLPEQSYHYSRSGGIPMFLSEVLNFILYNVELPRSLDRQGIEARLNR